MINNRQVKRWLMTDDYVIISISNQGLKLCAVASAQ